MIAKSDMVILLISDAAQVRQRRRRGRRVVATESSRAAGRCPAGLGQQWRCCLPPAGPGAHWTPASQSAAPHNASQHAHSLHGPPKRQAKLYPRILAAMKPGATLGLSHGFLLGVMQVGGACGLRGGRAGGAWARTTAFAAGRGVSACSGSAAAGGQSHTGSRGHARRAVGSPGSQPSPALHMRATRQTLPAPAAISSRAAALLHLRRTTASTSATTSTSCWWRPRWVWVVI